MTSPRALACCAARIAIVCAIAPMTFLRELGKHRYDHLMLSDVTKKEMKIEIFLSFVSWKSHGLCGRNGRKH